MKQGRRRLSLKHISMGLCLVAAVGWFGALRERSQAKAAKQRFESARNQYIGAVETIGKPSEEELNAAQARVLELTEMEARLRQYLLVPDAGGVLNEVSKRPADLVFQLQSMVDALGQEAQEHHVILKHSANAFGFGSVLKDALPPSPKDLQSLGRQCQLMHVLGAYLITAQPDQITGIEREPIPSIDVQYTGDVFTPTGAMVEKLRASFDVVSFRFSFSGKTQVLRAFLNEVSESAFPFFITDVSVKPEASAFQNRAHRPVVSGAGSQFQVTIAWIGEQLS